MIAPPENNNPVQESLKALGASNKQIKSWLLAINHSHKNNSMLTHKHSQQQIYSQEELPIAPSNWNAVRLFALLATQWRINGTRLIGIDYKAIEPTAKLADITLSQLIFKKLRFMEQATLEIYAELTT